jgi:cysteine desulfurase family protein
MRYLDNAATSFPKPTAVYDVMDQLARGGLGNPGRSGHLFARSSEQVVQETRARLARLIQARDPNRVILTLNGTDSLNIAIKGLLRKGDHVVTGTLEHNSVLRPLEGHGVETTRIPFDQEGYYRPDAIASAIRPDTRLVLLTHASNVLGTVQPVEAIGGLCQERGVLFGLDAAQSVGSVPLDVSSMPIDFVAAPGHKALFGPMGTGFLYVGPGVEIAPWREGGTGGGSESTTQPSLLPARLEAGTPNVPGLAGLLEGIKFVESLGLAEIADRERRWREGLIEGLRSIQKVMLLPTGRPDAGVPIVSFRVEGYSSQEVVGILDSVFEVAVRGGLHCAPLVHQQCGTLPDGAIRASGSALSGRGDVEHLVEAIREIARGS